MKPIYLLSLLTFCSSLFAYDVKLRVVDDQGKEVPHANVAIAFIGHQQSSSSTFEGLTNTDGLFGASGCAENSVFVSADREGYYGAKIYRLPKNKDIDEVVVIPRILNPIPLFYHRANPGIPIQDAWLGFDFEIGDWLPPYGKGKVADIQFRFKSEFKGYKDNIKDLEETITYSKRLYAARKEDWTLEKFNLTTGKWDAELDISFPGEKEGMHEELEFLTYSKLKLPHTAPRVGYESTYHYTSNNYSPPTNRDTMGFFLRSRVKLDETGNIVSANYAKLVGDIYVASTGVLLFTYYFNPTENDRNLEFDPNKNLFTAGRPVTDVYAP